jgi:hypothetical protein
MVKRVGLPQAALPTFLSFSQSQAFWDGNLGMIWDVNLSRMEEPKVDGRKQAMGFCTGITIVRRNFEGVCQ